MKPTFFFIHGGDAYDTSAAYLETLQNRPLRDPRGEGSVRWTDSLRPELGEKYDIFTPTMPCGANAHYEEWKIWFERHFEHCTDAAVLVGWSLGGIFLAKYLSENTVPFTVESLYLLAAPFCTSDFKELSCGDFILDPELIATLPQKVGEIVLMHSTDDFVVPYEHALLYQKLCLTAELVTYTNKNHFLGESFVEFYSRF